MDAKRYWDDKHEEYTTTDWIDKPSLFANWALPYLPDTGALLDLGAGQGQDSRFFEGKGYVVTSTDFSTRALELGRQKSSGNMSFKQVDLSEPLPFADQSYDIVYAHLSLHYFDRAMTEQLFTEIRRVLTPGGILAALFNSSEDPEMLEGKQLEDHFVEVNGIVKRYFSPHDARAFAKEFEIIIADDQGTTYKDEAKGIRNLVRLVAKK